MAFIYRDGIKYTAIVDINGGDLPEHPDYINEHAIYRRYEDDEPHYWVRDTFNNKWTELSNNPFEGATIDEDGKEGDVPQPLKEDVYRFIKGDGTWADVKAIYYNGIQNSVDFFTNPLDFIGGIRQYFKDNDAITTTTWYQGPGVGDLTNTVSGLVTISVVRLHDRVMITEELNVHESSVVKGHTQKRYGFCYIPTEKQDDIISIIDDIPSIDWWPWGHFEEVYGTATHSTDGRIGLVPKPNKKHEAKFLNAGGGWKDVEAFTHNGEFDPTTYLNDPRNMVVSIKRMFDVDDNITLAANILGTYNFGDGAKEIYGISEITLLRNLDSNLVAYEHVRGVDPTYGTPYEYSRIGNYTIPESARPDPLNIYQAIINWRPWNNINNNFTGSKLNADGAAGRVPKPLAENFDDVLTGSGIWRNAFIGDVIRDADANYDLDASPYLVQYVEKVYKRTRYDGYNIGAYSTETVSFPAKVKIPPSTSYVTGVCEMEISFNFAQSADWSTLILKQKFTVVENVSYGHVKEPIVYERTGTHGRPSYTYADITNPASYTWTEWTPSFIGATETTNGSYGHVPKPLAREEDYFLRGNGDWTPVSGTIVEGMITPSVADNPLAAIARVKQYYNLVGDSCVFDLHVDGDYDGIPEGEMHGNLNVTCTRIDGDKMLINELYTFAGEDSADLTPRQYARRILVTLPEAVTTVDVLDLEDIISDWEIDEWKSFTPEEMTGATETTDGAGGVVPAPLAREEDKFLRGNGTWDTVRGTITGTTVRGTGVFDNPIPEIVAVKRYFNTGESCALEVPVNGSYTIGDDTWVTGMLHIMAIRMYNNSFYVYETIEEANSTEQGAVRHIRVCTLTLPDDPATVDLSTYGAGSAWTRRDWKQINYPDVLKGATASADGKSGLVPKPMVDDQNKFLKGDGTWAAIEEGGDVYGTIRDEQVDTSKLNDPREYVAKTKRYFDVGEGATTMMYYYYFTTGTDFGMYPVLVDVQRINEGHVAITEIRYRGTIVQGNIQPQSRTGSIEIPTAEEGDTFDILDTSKSISWYDWNTFIQPYTVATENNAGTSGIVPAPANGTATRALMSNNGWTELKGNTSLVMTGASTSAAGKAGYAPAPAKGTLTHFLNSDGNWETVNGTITGNSVRGPGSIDNPVSEIMTVKRYFNVGESCALEFPVNGSYTIDGDAWVTGQIHIDMVRMYKNSAYIYETLETYGSAGSEAKKLIRLIRIPFPETNDAIDINLYQDTTAWEYNDWKKVNYAVFTRSTTANSGRSGNVPAPVAGTKTRVLMANDGWTELKGNTDLVMTGASSTAGGTAGYVPAPAQNKQSTFLRGDGTWTSTPYPSVMSGASSSAGGSSGLVPAPAKGAQNYFLKGNGSWSALPSLTTSQSGIVSTAPNDTNKCLLGNATWGIPEIADRQQIGTTQTSSTAFFTLDFIKETTTQTRTSAYYPLKETADRTMAMEYTVPAITNAIPTYSSSGTTYSAMYGLATIKIYRDRSSGTTKNAIIDVTFRRSQVSYHTPELEWRRIGFMNGKDKAVEDSDITWSEWQQNYSEINKYLATFTCNSTYFQSAAVQEVAKISPNAYIVHITCSAKSTLNANTEYVIANANGLKVCGKNPTLATTSGMYGSSGNVHGVCCFGNNGAIYGRFTSSVPSGTGIRIIATVVVP